jgi:5-methyltetrahydrofolate--homocysteine methyltransferase
VLDKITAAVAEVDEDETLARVKEALEAGTEPLDLVGALRDGMSTVGQRFESREYFLPDLILSAELFNEAIALIEPHLKVDEAENKGTVVIGTVHGDIHDIGKNIVATMLRCAGYQVTDLGVDVLPEVFVAKAKETGAGLVALSGLLSSAYDSMKVTVEAFTDAGLRDSVKVIIGGGMVNEKVLEYCGADDFGKDPTEAVRLAESLTAAGNGEGHK